MSDSPVPPPPQNLPPSNYPRPNLDLPSYNVQEIAQNLKLLTIAVLVTIGSIFLVFLPENDVLMILFFVLRVGGWLAAIVYTGRLAKSVGDSQALGILLALFCFLIGIVIYSVKATSTLKTLGYKVTNLGFSIQRIN